MPLLDLPNELLGAIFGFIGQVFFKEDFCRLMVCKRWYTLAIREYLREINITPKKIYRLLHSTTKDQSIELLQRHAHNIRFTTHDFYPFQAEETEDEDTTLEPLKQWVRHLHDHMGDLIPLLAGCISLQNLSFRTWRGVYGLYAASEQDKGEKYWLTTLTEEFTILLATVAGVISVGYLNSLTSLELDLRGCECVATREEDKLSSNHLCPLVAGLLLRKHMRRLLICVHRVCPDILQPASVPVPVPVPEPDTSTIWVEEFVLSITPHIGKHSQLCDGDGREEAVPYVFEQLAKNLLSQMARPKIVRVVSHDHPTPESIDIAYYLRVYDAIADEARLAECVSWTGEPLSLRSFKRRLEDLF